MPNEQVTDVFARHVARLLDLLHDGGQRPVSPPPEAISPTRERQLRWIIGFLQWWVTEGRFGLPPAPRTAVTASRERADA